MHDIPYSILYVSAVQLISNMEMTDRFICNKNKQFGTNYTTN